MSENITTLLRSVKLFQPLWEYPNEMALLEGILSTRSFESGALLIKEGELGDEMYILRTGEVEVFKTTVENEDYTLAKIGSEANPFFGELALMGGGVRTSSIRALSPVEVLVVNREQFEQLGDEHPQACLPIMRELAKIMSGRLKATSEDALQLFEALVGEIRENEIG